MTTARKVDAKGNDPSRLAVFVIRSGEAHHIGDVSFLLVREVTLSLNNITYYQVSALHIRCGSHQILRYPELARTTVGGIAGGSHRPRGRGSASTSNENDTSR